MDFIKVEAQLCWCISASILKFRHIVEPTIRYLLWTQHGRLYQILLQFLKPECTCLRNFTLHYITLQLHFCFCSVKWFIITDYFSLKYVSWFFFRCNLVLLMPFRMPHYKARFQTKTIMRYNKKMYQVTNSLLAGTTVNQENSLTC